MNDKIQYRPAAGSDIEKIKALLKEFDLPVSDIDNNKIDFVVAVNEKNDLVGCIGLERHGTDGLLRSLAVDTRYRNGGIAHELLNRLFSLSKQKGIINLHLLTTTAEKYFSRQGFSVLSRDHAPASIKSTVEFSSLCSSSSVYMTMKNLTETRLSNQNKV